MSIENNSAYSPRYDLNPEDDPGNYSTWDTDPAHFIDEIEITGNGSRRIVNRRYIGPGLPPESESENHPLSEKQSDQPFTRRHMLGAAAAVFGIPAAAAVAARIDTLDRQEPHPEQAVPHAGYWEHTASPNDTYWDIVVNRYGDSGLDSVLSFIERNVQNKSAEEEKREKVLLEKGYPYMKEPLQPGDELKITNPTMESTSSGTDD